MPDRVAVVANCQTQGIVTCLSALSPTLKIDAFHVNRMRTEKSRLDALEALQHYDLVLSQNMTQARFGGLGRETMEQRCSNIIFFPQIIFRGFHPDDAHLEYEGRWLMSPIGSHHSRLLCAAFTMKLPPERAVDLFNSYIFARLGYFDEYDEAKADLVAYAGDLGFDLSASIEKWRSTGVFMYLPTHPSIKVIADIAKKIAAKAGLPVTGTTGKLQDLLKLELILPVYPPLAKRLRVPGSTIIQLGKEKPTDGDANMGLLEFANQCYRDYASFPEKAFDTPRIKYIRNILREELVLA